MEKMEKNEIVLVSPFFPPNVGGLETHLQYLTNYLSQKNINATVITYKPLTTRTAFWERKEKKGSVSIIRINWFGHRLFEKFAKYPFLEFLYIFPGLFMGTLLYSLRNRKKISCFHAHGLAAASVVRIVNLFLKKRSILSTHYIYGLNRRPFFSKVLVEIFKGFDRLLPVGRDSQAELTQAGLDPKKMNIFRHWIDNQRIFVYKKEKTELRKKLRLPGDKKIVLFVGRLLEMKGIGYLLEMAVKNPGIAVVFVGDGEMKEKIEEQAKKFSNILYVGKKFSTELVDYYNAADMVALPSIEEASSLVVVEALSCGKPIIVTNRGCSKDMFDDYLGEKIVPSAENILLAVENIIRRKIEDPLLEEKCRQFAVINYSEKNAQEIIDNYL
jgi:glycosyltransferase involved in cell wall biosynthesis